MSLARWRPLRALLSHLWHAGREVVERLPAGDWLQERLWARRRLFGAVGLSVGSHRSASDPHRPFLLEQITALSPTSVLEIGCYSGVDLFLLARAMPTAALHGLDINAEAIQDGTRRIAEMGLPAIRLDVGKADDLGPLARGSVDVVFSDAVLMYVGPRKISKVPAEMARVASKAVVLSEWQGSGPEGAPHLYYKGHWVHDFPALLSPLLPAAQVCVKPYPPECSLDEGWRKYGAVIEAIR